MSRQRRAFEMRSRGSERVVDIPFLPCDHQRSEGRVPLRDADPHQHAARLVPRAAANRFLLPSLDIYETGPPTTALGRFADRESSLVDSLGLGAKDPAVARATT